MYKYMYISVCTKGRPSGFIEGVLGGERETTRRACSEQLDGRVMSSLSSHVSDDVFLSQEPRAPL